MNYLSNKQIKYCIALILFVSGIFYLYSCSCSYFYSSQKEGLQVNHDTTKNSNKLRCPNLLVQEDKNIYLYNTRLAEVPGVNPIKFNNLEEYNSFLDWQVSQGIQCPVLVLQKSYNAQGNREYKIRPSINDPQGGLLTVFLKTTSKLGDYDSFAYPYDDDVIDKVPMSDAEIYQLEKQFESNFNKVSNNPMHSNWIDRTH